ncbi:MAG: MFS transporter [Hydrotalea sp.]|nr:MFS transporter [Hydrotalea sp.]
MIHPSLSRTVAIQLSVLLIIAAMTYHGVIIQIQASDYNISTLGIGIINSFFYIGYFVSCILTKRFIAAWGYIRGHALMTTIYGLATLLFPIHPGVVTWSLLYGICGIASGGMFVVFETWLNFATDNKGRGQIMAMYIIMITLGKIIGNYAFNYISSFSFSHYSYITMFILASMLPLLTTTLQQPSPVTGNFLSFRAVYKISPAALVVLFLSQIGSASANSLGAILGKMMGFNSWYISNLMSLIFVSAIVMQLPLGNLSNRVDRRLVMLWVAVVMAIGNLMLIFSAIDTRWFWLAMVLIGATIYNFYPLAMAHINDLLHEQHRAAVTAQLLLVASIGQTIGPLTTSYFMAHFGYKGFSMVLLAESALILLFLLNRLRVRHPTKQDRTVIKFVPELPMAPSVVQPVEAKIRRTKK